VDVCASSCFVGESVEAVVEISTEVSDIPICDSAREGIIEDVAVAGP
jgi:hypothetical protein